MRHRAALAASLDENRQATLTLARPASPCAPGHAVCSVKGMAKPTPLTIGLSVLTILALSSAEAPADSPSLPACIQVSSEARYHGVGYDHIVHLASTCSTEAACKVASDVSKEPVQASVPAGAAVEVVILRGSPAREFKPRVSCDLVL